MTNKIDEQQTVPLLKRRISWFQKAVGFTKLLIKRYSEANISDNSKVIAYFTLLSIFPLLIVIGNILPLLHLEALDIMAYVQTAVPPTIYNSLLPIIKSLLDKSNGSLLSIGVLGTLWASSKGVSALKNSINKVYGVDKNQNFVLKRLISLGTTLVMLLLVVSLIVVFTFGQQVLELLAPIFKFPMEYISIFETLKWPVTFVALFIVLTYVYFFIPNVKMRFKSVLPGALLTTIGWLFLSQGFSLYVRYFGTAWNSYGTIGVFIILLLWLNFSATVLMTGAVLNITVEESLYGSVDEKRGKVHDFLEKKLDKVGTK
ncbi:YihY/virulence factor BrkB family protein [Latilactobacillus sakei]|uniref:YihY/virulence factor BrkB family protein n=1 Tax=Latilactobacillus sakei TaxID=1599 RepID=UPI0038F62474